MRRRPPRPPPPHRRALAGIERPDVSPLNALFAQAAVGARRVASVRPHLQLPAPRVSGPARVRAPRVPKPARVQRPAKVKAPRAPRAPGRAVHVRWGRVLSRGLSLGLVAAGVISLPPGTGARARIRLCSRHAPG